MSWKPLLLAVTFLAVTFAGCISDDPAPAPEPQTAEPPTATADTGSIKGQVAASNLDLLAGASVFLVRGADIKETTTDAEGRFTFNAVAPGQVQVQVSRIGYQNAVRLVDVEANKVHEVSFLLEPLIVKDPYKDSHEFSGFYECAFGTLVITDTCTFAWRTAYDAYKEETGQEPPFPRDPQANNKNTYYWSIEKDAQAVMSEMVWGAGGGTTERMMMLLSSTPVHNDCDCSDDDYIQSTGTSPQRALIGRDLPDIYPEDVFIDKDGSKLFSRLDAAENGTVEVASRGFLPFSASLGYSHGFTIYMTAFYNHYPEPDFTAIPDQ